MSLYPYQRRYNYHSITIADYGIHNTVARAPIRFRCTLIRGPSERNRQRLQPPKQAVDITVMQHLASTGPVTSLCFVGDVFLLVGRGSFVKVYDVAEDNRRLLITKRVFVRERVHGIISHELQYRDTTRRDILTTQIFFWGGKSVLLLSLGRSSK